MRIALLAATAMLSAAATGQVAEVYRSVDAQGNVSYSDRPVDESSQVVFIATPRPATPTPARSSTPAPTPTMPTEGEPVSATAAAAEPPPPTPDELEAERTANCQAARERNDRYLNSRRLFRALPDGEREYLSDAEIDAARAAAVADVEKWCN